MKRHRVRVISVVSCLLFIPSIVTAQGPITGLPPLSSIASGPFDAMDLGNLNVHFSIPVFSRPGKGIPFSYSLSYDSLIWYPVTSGSTTSWQPVSTWGWTASTSAATGYVTASTTSSITCYYNQNGHQVPGEGSNVTSAWAYHDPSGGVHSVPGTVTVIWVSDPTGTCSYQGSHNGSWTTSTVNAVATDNSGYTLVATTASAATVTSPQGIVISPPVNATTGLGGLTDPNNNQISVTVNGSTTTITDTLATTALTISGSAPSPVQYKYTAPSSATASVTVTYRSYTVTTQFGVSGISEYSASGVSLVDKVTLPDGTAYQFYYETTGTGQPYTGTGAGPVTGRIAQVTLPTNGVITYTYGSSNSMMRDGSPSYLQRNLGGGTWTYTRAAQSGQQVPQTATTVVDPANNETDLNFSGIYETQRYVYQGTGGSKTVLKATYSCYNGNWSNCATATVTAPITYQAFYDYLNQAGPQYAAYEYSYESHGLLTNEVDHDYTTGDPILRTIITNYNTSLCSSYNVCNRPLNVQVNDSTGASKSYTTYIYDAGVNTHGSVTKVSRSTSGTTAGPFLSQQYSYNSDGTLATATDPNGTVTNYGYAGISCNNAFPTSIAVLGMTTTYAYNCTGGVVISAQDPNNATITTNYSDPFFWRPASTTDPLNNTTYFNYYGVSNSGTSAVTNVGQTESVMTFNGGNSTTDLLTTPDGYGRPVLQQTRQGPGSSNWDTVQTAYDGAARVQFVTAPYVSTAGAAQGPEPAEYWTYDGLNRVIDEKNYWYSIDINYSYNLNDVQVTVGPAPSGENTKRRQFEYDGLRRLTSVCELTSASGSSCGQNTNGVTSAYRTAYTYDAVGNLMGVNQSGQTRSFSYDGLGRMLSETNPETSANGTGATLNYYYDYESTCGRATGDKVKRVDPANNVTCYGYDGLHRLTQVSYPSGANAAGTATKTYIYDNASPWGVNVANPMGRLTGALTTINGTTTTAMFFSYDGRGQILENWNVAVAGGNIWSAVTQSYYSNGALASIQGNGGHQFNFTIDGEGRPFAMTDVTAGNTPWSSTLYNVASQPTSVSLLSGSESFTYDQTTGHMTGWQSAAGSTTQTGALTWNTNGTVQQLAVSGQPPCSYTYDDLARLSSANCGTTWTQNFGYDAFGNITKTVPTGSSGASFAAIYGSGNHVTNFGESYDAMGNTTKDNLGNSYSYDAEGRPLSLPGVTQVYYDAFNRAMTINRSGTYTNYLFTAAGQRYATMTGGTWQKYFLPLPAGMQAVYTPSGLQYYRHADWLGSSRFASTPSGAVQYSLGYAPFGETYSESGTVDRVYTGQTQDTVAGSTALYDFQFRQHASSQGRWLVPDPAGLAAVDPTNPQTWNRYAYVGNNPLNQVDAKGLCSWDETCPMIQESNGGFGGGGGLTPSAIASAWWNATFSAANSSISMAAWEEASLRLTMGDNYYMLPGKGNPQAQEEARHEAIITYGWDPTWDLQQKYSWAQGVISGNLTTFNGYTVNNNVAMCTAWAESSFDPRASNVSGPSDTGAWGLFQTRQIALTDFNKHFGTQYTLSDVHNSADISAYVGTGYLSLAIGTYHGGDVTIGLTAAGPGGSSYAKGIGNCASSLDAGNGVSAFK